MKTGNINQGDIYAILEAEMQDASSEKRAARTNKRAERQAARSEKVHAVEKHYEASMKQIQASIVKNAVSIATAPFGAIGSIVSGAVGIGIDNSMGKQAADMERQAGLIEIQEQKHRDRAEEHGASERDLHKRIEKSYDAGIRIAEAQAQRSKLA